MAPGPGNPELEAAIFDDPHDEQAWAVYADWLQQRDDPHGELITLWQRRAQAEGADLEALDARTAAIEDAHRGAWLGELSEHLEHPHIDEVLTLTWERGYVVAAGVGGSNEDWEDADGPAPAALLRALVDSPAARFLHTLHIGTTTNEDEDWVGDLAGNIRALVERDRPLEALTKLEIADTQDYWDISSTIVGPLDELLALSPRLRELYVRGGEIELEALAHPQLRELALETGGLSTETATAIGRCQLPMLHELSVYFGDQNYGASASLSDLAPLLSAAGVPQLRSLGLCNAEFSDQIPATLAGTPILRQLETLDLSFGTLSDRGGEALLEHAENFAHLEELNLDCNFLSEDMIARLGQRLPMSVARGQREAYISAGQPHYYVSVGE